MPEITDQILVSDRRVLQRWSLECQIRLSHFQLEFRIAAGVNRRTINNNNEYDNDDDNGDDDNKIKYELRSYKVPFNLMGYPRPICLYFNSELKVKKFPMTGFKPGSSRAGCDYFNWAFRDQFSSFKFASFYSSKCC